MSSSSNGNDGNGGDGGGTANANGGGGVGAMTRRRVFFRAVARYGISGMKAWRAETTKFLVHTFHS